MPETDSEATLGRRETAKPDLLKVRLDEGLRNVHRVRHRNRATKDFVTRAGMVALGPPATADTSSAKAAVRILGPCKMKDEEPRNSDPSMTR